MIGSTKLCPQGIGLVFLDLDDTILIDGAKVSPRVLDTIGLVRERGCMACVSTGRALHMVPELLRQPQHMDYLVCANGSRVYDTFGDVLHEQLMTREQVLAAMDAVDPLKPAWNAFIEDASYFEWRSMSYMVTGRRQPMTQSTSRQALHTGMGRYVYGLGHNMRRAARLAKRILLRSDGNSQVLSIRPYVEAAETGICKIGCSLPSREACEAAMVIFGHLGCFEVARMSWAELEITAKGANKGVGAQWLMDYLGIDPACAVAFGDSENDAPLAEVCGTFVAMANSDGHVRGLADDVCESVYDDGVARWLERAIAEADGARHV